MSSACPPHWIPQARLARPPPPLRGRLEWSGCAGSEAPATADAHLLSPRPRRKPAGTGGNRESERERRRRDKAQRLGKRGRKREGEGGRDRGREGVR
eukprot:1599519-Rhodomonas_salina.1